MEASAIRTGSDAKPRRNRSAVSNGTRLFVERPGDTAWARRFGDVLAEILSDAHSSHGSLSESQRQLARRCATIAIECEKLECAAAAGTAIDLEIYGRLTDRLGRTFQRLGLSVSRDVEDDLVERYRSLAKGKVA